MGEFQVALLRTNMARGPLHEQLFVFYAIFRPFEKVENGIYL